MRSIPHVPRTPRPAPCMLLESPAPSTPAPDEEEERADGADDAMARHILVLRMAFCLSVVVDGVVDAGHRGIELVRGDAAVRCRACGQDIARCAELVGATVRDESLYEFTLTGLRRCPAARNRRSDYRVS